MKQPSQILEWTQQAIVTLDLAKLLMWRNVAVLQVILDCPVRFVILLHYHKLLINLAVIGYKNDWPSAKNQKLRC